MRVKCISDKDSFLIKYKNLTVGKTYNVTVLDEDYSMGTNVYTIVDDNGFCFTHGVSIFREIEEEDKMENRIVRKLEDLDGLENGMGLVLKIEDNKFKIIYRQTGDLIRNLIIADCHVPIVKAMGFKFEYKPLRTVEKVLEEMKANSLKNSSSLYEVRCEFNYEKNESIYSVFKNIYSVTLGAYVFSEETAQKYADELNEIAGGK